jgi:Zn-dependent peptidase ImmA (M78 family)
LRLAVIFALALVTACAGEGDAVIDRMFDPCAPLVLDTSSATPAQQDGVRDAIALWSSRGVTSFADPAIADAPVIPVLFEEASPAVHGYYDDETAVIYVNSVLDADPEARAVTIAHELGHAFGLYHVERGERVSVMNPANLRVPPTEDDQHAVELLWGRCAD